MKLTLVLCQALTESGLENKVLIQLQIGLDKNVKIIGLDSVLVGAKALIKPHSTLSSDEVWPAGLKPGCRAQACSLMTQDFAPFLQAGDRIIELF